MIAPTRDLLSELYRTDGKAEIINGEIVRFGYDGVVHSVVQGAIMCSLREYIRRANLPGRSFGATLAFVVDLPHRQSFCADTGYYVRPNSGMKFPVGVPAFAVEIRNEWECETIDDKTFMAKCADYFAAGAQVVWDVDLLNDPIIRVYCTPEAEYPAITFHRGEVANAEPAVPGWTMPVDDLFE